MGVSMGLTKDTGEDTPITESRERAKVQTLPGTRIGELQALARVLVCSLAKACNSPIRAPLHLGPFPRFSDWGVFARVLC